MLMWDNLEFIVPYERFRPHYTDREIAEAVDLIGIMREPTREEKTKAHEAIEEFATRSLPSSFYYQAQGPGTWLRYGMYPQKLLPETWDMLSRLGLIGARADGPDYPLEDTAGLAFMSILTDCCAGQTLARVTDRKRAYAALTNLLVDDSVGNTDRQDHLESVIPLTLSVVKTDEIPLNRLIALRKREMRSGGNELRDLRHRYVKRISEHIKLLEIQQTTGDVKELNRQFKDDMKEDLRILKQELGFAGRESLSSKEIVVTAVGAFSAAVLVKYGIPIDLAGVVTGGGTATTIGGLFATWNKYSATRRNIMRKYPMAYMFEAARP